MRLALTLASRSPQRRAILEQLGIEFVAVTPDVAERDAGQPGELVLSNARLKASAVAGELVLGVDTLVALDGEIHGKPRDAAGARRTLAALAGRTHEVWGGLVLFAGGQERTAVVLTEVSFRSLSAAQIDWYVGTGEWRGRAGGYAIQERGAALVTAISGDFQNVVGLPVAALLDLEPGLVFPR